MVFILKPTHVPSENSHSEPLPRHVEAIPPTQRHGEIRPSPDKERRETLDAFRRAIFLAIPIPIPSALHNRLRPTQVCQNTHIIERKPGRLREALHAGELIERFAEPECFLVRDLRGGGEGAGHELGGVAQREHVFHVSLGLLSFLHGLGARGGQLHAEMVVDERHAGARVALDDPLPLHGIRDLALDRVRRGRRVPPHVVECFSYEWVVHVARRPHAHADAHVAAFLRADRVHPAADLAVLVCARFLVVGEPFPEFFDVV